MTTCFILILYKRLQFNQNCTLVSHNSRTENNSVSLQISGLITLYRITQIKQPLLQQPLAQYEILSGNLSVFYKFPTFWMVCYHMMSCPSATLPFMLTQQAMKGRRKKKTKRWKAAKSGMFIHWSEIAWICSVIKFYVLYGNTTYFYI